MTPLLCPRCHRENRPSSSFCIFCGAPLVGPTAQGGEPAQEGADGKPLSLQEEVRELRLVLVRLTA